MRDGALIAAGVLIALLLTLLLSAPLLAWLPGAIHALLVVGLWDDLWGMRPLIKLSFQTAVAALAWWLGLSIERLFLPWGMVELGGLSLPLTMVWIAPRPTFFTAASA